MARLAEIVTFSDELLSTSMYQDYCPNGLQVEGKLEINKIVSGVTASQALIDGAINKGADLILVHHGFFWKGEPAPIVGRKKSRIASLLESDVSLLAYHLPLDDHSECGNNAQLAKRLGLKPFGKFGWEKKQIGLLVEAEQPMFGGEFSARIESVLGRKPLHISSRDKKTINTIAICTGGAQSYFEAAIAEGVDAFVTGEVSEQSYHLAMESGVDFFAAGHHATERYGVQALGEMLADAFSLEYEYFEIDNPV